MSNTAWAKQILDHLFAQGVDEITLCPGARNAPFVEVLAHWKNPRMHSFFEERSAAFFTLGRIAQSGRPKAIITTSGTAVANLLPAVVEAHYTGAPLVIVSADRPRSYRGTGAPQTIVQPGIFSHYVRNSADLERGEPIPFTIDRHGPSHLNVCLQEPLMDEPAGEWSLDPSAYEAPHSAETRMDRWQEFASHSERPLIVVGGLSSVMRPVVLEWLTQQQCPVYLESTSGLRGTETLSHLEIWSGEKTLRTSNFGCVVRIGHVPTARVWRDLENSTIPVFSVSELPFPGLSRSDATTVQWTTTLLGNVVFKHPRLKQILFTDRSEWSHLQRLIEEIPKSEVALVHRISNCVEPNDRVYLGNSLPIREWDLAARRDTCVEQCFANRGANGIDGQLSTFFGWAEPVGRNFALLGDLTALYDLSAPWVLPSRRLAHIGIFIINNGGGRIFQPMFREPLFENRHTLSFSKWAEMWGLPYSRWSGDGVPELSGVVEVVPDAQQTEQFRSLW